MNPLVIAYYYSIENSSTGQILRRFFPNLPDEFHSTIVTAKSQIDYSTNNCEVLGVRESSMAIMAEKVLRNIGMNDIMMTPDYYRYSWGINALRLAERKLSKHKFDYLHTISFPSSSHLIGYKLKKQLGLPWVAQLYDPWHGNPYRPIVCQYFVKKDCRYESLVANYADLIILPCKELVEDWHMRYGSLVENKILELPFITEPVADRSLEKKGETLTISMIGTSNSKRMSSTFYEALRLFIEENPRAAKHVRVYQVGYITEEEKNIIKKFGLEDIVIQTGRLSENECVKYFQTADIFLAVDADVPKNYFFPSKLLKYFSYQRPILGLVTCNSVMSRELNQSGHVAISMDNVLGIKEYLNTAITNYDSLCGFDIDYRKKFYPSSVVNRYTTYLERILF